MDEKYHHPYLERPRLGASAIFTWVVMVDIVFVGCESVNADAMKTTVQIKNGLILAIADGKDWSLNQETKADGLKRSFR